MAGGGWREDTPATGERGAPTDRGSVAWRIRKTGPAEGEIIVSLLRSGLNAEG